MVNLNKETVKKIKYIEKQADSILKNASDKSEEIISGAKLKAPELLKESKQKLDSEKSLKVESARNDMEEKTRHNIEDGISKISQSRKKLESRIESAAELSCELFIKKIESMEKPAKNA